MAETCRNVASDPSLKGDEAALAFFHAARAYQASGDARQAVSLARESLDRLPNRHQLLTTPPRGLRTEAQAAWRARSNRFQFDRAMLLANAYLALAEEIDNGPIYAESAILCRDRQDCLTRALSTLNAERAILVPFEEATPAGASPEANAFHLLRGQVYEARAFGSDADSAINDYETVVAAMPARPDDPSLPQARTRLETLAVRLGNEAAAGDAARDAQMALRFFDRALAANPRSVPALAGKGAAAYTLAQRRETDAQQRRSYYLTATQAYEAIAAESRSPDEARAQAQFRLGETATAWAVFLEGLRNPTAADRAEIPRLRARAVSYFEAAVADAPDAPSQAVALEALAQAYRANGQYAEAGQGYRLRIAQLLGQSDWTVPGDPDETAAFRSQVAALPGVSARRDLIARLLDLASVREAELAELGPLQVSNGPRVVDILLAAEAASEAGGSGNALIAPQLKLAEYFLDSGDHAAAERRLANVIASTATSSGLPTPTLEDERARAFYLRSRAEAMRLGTGVSENGVRWAEEAVKLEGSRPEYRTQACLAHILRGGEAVTEPGSESWCSGSPGPEGHLLRGMFYLRYAQYAPSGAGLRDTAQFAFNQGLDDMNASPDPDASPRFGWPTVSRTPPSLRTLLTYGRAKAISCGGVSTTVDLPGSEIARAEDFFQDYRVASCTR